MLLANSAYKALVTQFVSSTARSRKGNWTIKPWNKTYRVGLDCIWIRFHRKQLKPFTCTGFHSLYSTFEKVWILIHTKKVS